MEDQKLSQRLAKSMTVFCDAQDDVVLFHRLQLLSPLLRGIPTENIFVYPQSKSAETESHYPHIFPLFEFDRPDFIICVETTPICVIEVTEHAYTGDNGLQRFTRAASAAENGVPHIYFGPAARVRDDELDKTDDAGSLSKRNVTSDLFVGFGALNRVFSTPQLFCEWETGPNGKARKLGRHPSSKDLENVYGYLVRTIVSIIVEYSSTLDVAYFSKSTQNECHKNILQNQSNVTTLANNKNTLTSEVKYKLSRKQIVDLISDPGTLTTNLIGEEYFLKGKPDKLLARYAIETMSIRSVMTGDGTVISDKKTVASIMERVKLATVFKNGCIAYYSGYKWRSDPHCGVAINIYYRECFVNEQLAFPLLMIYPRISLMRKSTQQLSDNVSGREFIQLFIDRYQSDYREKYKKTVSSRGLYDTWNVGVKQDRIFRRYCSLVLCHDGIVIGQPLWDKIK